MRYDMGFSSIASENLRYSSFVQNDISPASFAPIFMVLHRRVRDRGRSIASHG